MLDLEYYPQNSYAPEAAAPVASDPGAQFWAKISQKLLEQGQLFLYPFLFPLSQQRIDKLYVAGTHSL